ncbi:WYL domain-containing protein [Caenimonas sedimenti]|uniref:WYL domain-containing protein n=1 Tax=Caenimonas sedimenti TaxID=2596921 RepID=A0A562ZIP1_9BURK|nr:WYL domain-containing protein [Caenimonas sedimenti]TWO68064.1 WYL domain-containing protein [Caenimonas sedimenti]
MEDHPETKYSEAVPHPASWSQDRRLKFIDYRLRWEGRLNRTDLIEHFDISAPQATADLGKYTEAAPFNLAYDLKQKAFMRTEGYAPLYPRSSSRAYLNELLALVTDVIDSRTSFIGWHPEVGVAPIPSRQLDGRSLSLLVQAIRDKRMVALAYQGMKKPGPEARVLSPHALGYDGFRWHVRAYCHSSEKYKDFVIGRMTDVSLAGASEKGSGQDESWHRVLQLVIAPHPLLPAGAKRAIRLDYGMIDGILSLSCRHALLFYALRRLGLHREEGRSPEEQQIVLLNRDELAPFMQPGHA